MPDFFTYQRLEEEEGKTLNRVRITKNSATGAIIATLNDEKSIELSMGIVEYLNSLVGNRLVYVWQLFSALLVAHFTTSMQVATDQVQLTPPFSTVNLTPVISIFGHDALGLDTQLNINFSWQQEPGATIWPITISSDTDTEYVINSTDESPSAVNMGTLDPDVESPSAVNMEALDPDSGSKSLFRCCCGVFPGRQ